MPSTNPYTIVSDFEQRVAEWCGAPYGVAVESGTAALFLSLKSYNHDGWYNGQNVIIPSKTYPSVPCSIIHCGMKPMFVDMDWEGEYELEQISIWDAALRFRKGMYHGGMQCLSFHVKKHLPIGRGGMILLDDKEKYEWLLRARFDGRRPVPLQEDNFTMLGWNMYMSVEQAARGIELFETLRRKNPNGLPDLKVEEQGYPDLSKYNIYKR